MGEVASLDGDAQGGEDQDRRVDDADVTHAWAGRLVRPRRQGNMVYEGPTCDHLDCFPHRE
jgi:hypothetical protein